jgi:peroxiredoxin Q/BCP
MHKIVKIITLLGVLSMSVFGSTPEVGAPAPKFSLEDQSGVMHSLEDYEDKKLVVYFFPKADTPG